jgi:hypothetical protein
MPDDAIRLTLPADEDLGAVAVAAVGALARRAGLGGDAITELRQTVADAYDTVLAQGTGAAVEVTARMRSDQSFVEITRGSSTQTYRQHRGR